MLGFPVRVVNRLVTLLLSLCLPPTIATAISPLQPSDLQAGTILVGSTSPNGKLCFIEAFISPYTMNAIVLAAADRTRVVAEAPLATAYSTDLPHRGRISIIWSPDSTRVALHDAISKNSTLAILRERGDNFEVVTLPDLLEEACQRWRIKRGSIASSAQRPLRWITDDSLEIEVSAKTKSGQKRALTIRLRAPRDGAPSVIPS